MWQFFVGSIHNGVTVTSFSEKYLVPHAPEFSDVTPIKFFPNNLYQQKKVWWAWHHSKWPYEILVSGGSNFDTNLVFHKKNWYLQLKFETSVRSLKLIVWPQEVSEVTKVKTKKILGENPKITNFCLTEMLYTSKKS